MLAVLWVAAEEEAGCPPIEGLKVGTTVLVTIDTKVVCAFSVFGFGAFGSGSGCFLAANIAEMIFFSLKVRFGSSGRIFGLGRGRCGTTVKSEYGFLYRFIGLLVRGLEITEIRQQ